MSVRERKLSYDEGDAEGVRLERSAIFKAQSAAPGERGDPLRELVPSDY